MTRFVVIADTHLTPDGAEPEGYHQQPRYVTRLPELLSPLDAWIRSRAGGPEAVDFVLHLGDMLDRASPEAVEAAQGAFRLSVPTYLCLGNHDMATEPGATEPADALWAGIAPAFFPSGKLTASLDLGDGVLHVVPTQWCEVPFLWREEQRPHFLDAQIAHLEHELGRRLDVPHILCTHGDVVAPTPWAQPPRAGTDVHQAETSPSHAGPPRAYTDTVLDLARRFPQLRLVLSGHTHFNTHEVVERTHLVTASALVETPFEFKVVEVTRSRLRMTTLPLLPEVTFRAAYDWDKVWVQGRRFDRAFEIVV